MPSLTEAIKRQVFKSPALTAALRRLRVLLHYLARQPHEADFNFLRHPAFASGLLLDLGANIGQSALSVHKVQPGLRVLSIEANPACEPGLGLTRRLLGSNFSYRLLGVGAQAGDLPFHVPVRASRMLLEEGTFALDSLQSVASVARLGRQGQDYTLHTLQIPVLPVDALGLAPRVVKMDLQGLELPALAGMRQTLLRHHPALMLEVGDGQPAVVAWLAALGYAPYFWDGQALQPGQRSSSLNAMFLVAGDAVLAPIA